MKRKAKPSRWRKELKRFRRKRHRKLIELARALAGPRFGPSQIQHAIHLAMTLWSRGVQ